MGTVLNIGALIVPRSTENRSHCTPMTEIKINLINLYFTDSSHGPLEKPRDWHV